MNKLNEYLLSEIDDNVDRYIQNEIEDIITSGSDGLEFSKWQINELTKLVKEYGGDKIFDIWLDGVNKSEIVLNYPDEVSVMASICNVPIKQIKIVREKY